MSTELIIRELGQQDYYPIWQLMHKFSAARNIDTPDEIWLVEHNPVFTLGQSGKTEHLLNPGTIPVIQVDRGGQVTYHGPGQLIAYTLINLQRRKINVKQLVCSLEQALIQTLAEFNIQAHLQTGAPGVYVNNAKIASLGLRIRHGCSFHGLSLNVGMDLEPFTRINPCGQKGLVMTQLCEQGGPASLLEVTPLLVKHLRECLGDTL